jgi:hypothetical protein
MARMGKRVVGKEFSVESLNGGYHSDDIEVDGGYLQSGSWGHEFVTFVWILLPQNKDRWRIDVSMVPILQVP